MTRSLALMVWLVPTLALASPIDREVDRGVVRRVIHKHRAALVRCYQKATPLPEGTLVVRFVIDRIGGVRTAERDTTSTIAAPVVEACVLTEVKRWHFPPTPDGSEVTIVYPFRFEPTPVGR